jgi:hypothetical protein
MVFVNLTLVKTVLHVHWIAFTDLVVCTFNYFFLFFLFCCLEIIFCTDVCGDSYCDASIGENCTTCYEDCGVCGML